MSITLLPQVVQGSVTVSTLGPHLQPAHLRGEQGVLVRGAGVEAGPALLLHLATAMEEEGEEPAASCIRDIVDLLHLVAEHLVMSAPPSSFTALFHLLLPSRTVWWCAPTRCGCRA